MALDHAQDGLRGAREEVPPIGHLHRARSAAARAARMGSRPVSCDDADARVALEPPGQRVGAAIGQEVHDAAALEVADDRAPAMALAPRPAVDPHDAQPSAGMDAIPCTAVLLVAISAPDQAQERVAARGEASRWSGAGGAAKGKPEMALKIAQPVGAPPVAPRDPNEPFDEDATRAARRRASEAPGSHPDHDGPPLPGQVMQEPSVAAVDVP